jgi:hypothetical protein
MQTERIGVSAVSLMLEEMGFVFREQVIEDYGIDAIIEERKPGYLSGKLISVQIKSGESYFSGKDKATFYIDEKHYNYWLNYSIPVILVLYNPISKLCIYEKVEKDKLIKTDNAWKIEIPLSNLLSDAGEALRNIGQSEYQRKLSTLALSKYLMILADDGELILEVLEWVNKSSGRGEFILKRVDYDANETVLSEKTIWGFGLRPYDRVIRELFPWAEIEVDYDFYDMHEDRNFVMAARDGKKIYPYENRVGEVDAYRLKLDLNEIGRSFLIMDQFLNEGRMYNITF